MPQMGWLARQDGYDPNAFDVPLEQSTGVGWANRLGEILTTRRPDDPTVVATTASPLVTITEGDIGRATEAAMAASGGGLSTKGIKAYHSSPHDFDKFDLAKIGTGEGAQVYGHGLYFAENPAVSGQGGQYWNQFLRHTSLPKHELEAAQILRNNNFDRAAAAQEVEGLVKHYDDKYSRDMLKVLQSNKPVGPRTYEVEINADPARFLDWDKGLHRQSPEVQGALERFGVIAKPRDMHTFDDALMKALTGDANATLPKQPWDPTGAQIYESSRLVSGGYRDKAKASQVLNEAGIPGIKYLDEGSRRGPPILNARIQYAGGKYRVIDDFGGSIASADDLATAKAYMAGTAVPNPTNNYVVFDPNIVRIMKKYGIAGAAPAGIGALAAQDQYEGAY